MPKVPRIHLKKRFEDLSEREWAKMCLSRRKGYAISTLARWFGMTEPETKRACDYYRMYPKQRDLFE